MRHTSKHRNNRIRLQKIHKKLAKAAKQAKKAARKA
jgi:hypothetical protein